MKFGVGLQNGEVSGVVAARAVAGYDEAGQIQPEFFCVVGNPVDGVHELRNDLVEFVFRA